MSERIDGLDLLRGVAVGLVLLRHALPAAFPGAGVVGVVMFFAISGHLISGLLLDEVARTGRIDLRRFYLRRARRLLPALVGLVAGVVVVTAVLDPIGDRAHLATTAVKALTFTGDLPFGTSSDATYHLWTLGVEEQFYLLWPAVLLLAVPRRLVPQALLTAGGLCVVGCVLTVLGLRTDPDLAYALPTSWAVCFVVGAASRVLAVRGRPAYAVVPVVLGALGVLAVVPLRGHAWTYLAAAPVIAALTGVLLVAWRSWGDVTSRLLRPLVGLGVVSYAVYLWDYPLTIWLRPQLPCAGVLAACASIGLAVLGRYAARRRRRAHPVPA